VLAPPVDLGPAGLALAGLSAVAAGTVNALAGGGTLITFPLLTALGVPAIAANITNTVALCPGNVSGALAQREAFRGQRARLPLLLVAGMVGGLAGGVLLLATGEQAFRRSVPYLLLLASALLASQDRVRSWLLARAQRRGQSAAPSALAPAAVAVASVYGGYFGAGLGVILLAALGATSDETLTRLNAVKQLVSLAVNLSAAVFFLFSGHIVWPAALVMAAGAVVGGALGGVLASRIPAIVLRRLVVTTGIVLAGVYFVRW
jgi:uncharacterized membrane protein YfcA